MTLKAMRLKLVPALLCFLAYTSVAQPNDLSAWHGVWQGKMYMYRAGKVKDSVQIRLTVAPTASANEWIWKTEYLSPTIPVVKDYKMRMNDPAGNVLVVDEGDGIELLTYRFNQKLFNVFETSGFMLTSTYELINETIIFEVSSGTKVPSEQSAVTNYTVMNLQRAVLQRIP